MSATRFALGIVVLGFAGWWASSLVAAPALVSQTGDRIPGLARVVANPANLALADVEKDARSKAHRFGGHTLLSWLPVPQLSWQQGAKAVVVLRGFYQQKPVRDASLVFHYSHGRHIQTLDRSYDSLLPPTQPVSAKTLPLFKVKKWFPPDATVFAAPNGPFGQQYYRISADKPHRLIAVQAWRLQWGAQIYQVEMDVAAARPYTVVAQNLNWRQPGLATGIRLDRHLIPESAPLPFLRVTTAAGPVTANAEGVFADLSSEPPQVERLAGPYAEASSFAGNEPDWQVTEDGGVWQIVLTEPDLEDIIDNSILGQATAFVAVNQIAQDARTIIGEDVPWLSHPLPIKTDFPTDCNASFDGEKLVFFRGSDRCRNSALLVDVVRHEWGHGLDHARGGIVDRAFSEGFGDIMAMLQSGDPCMGAGFFVAEPERCIRNLEGEYRYPEDRSSSPHTEGLILGASFWHLQQNLAAQFGSEQANQLAKTWAYQLILGTEYYTDAYATLLALDDDNGDLTDFTPHYCPINLAFARHGLATEDEACHHGRIATTAFDQGGSSRLDPGDFVTLKAVAWNGQRHTIENLSASLSTTSAGVDITATELQWPAVWPFQSKENPERWTLQLASDLPCGELLNFAIRTQTAAGPDERQQSFQLRLGEYSGSPYQAQLPDLPITLRDNDTTVIPLTFAAASGLTAFQLQGQLTVDHPFPFDVRIDLVAPTGESYAVYRPRADDFEVAVDFSFTEAELKGVALTGTWQLVVTDQSAGDTGTLEQLAMTVLTDEFRCHKSVTKTD